MKMHCPWSSVSDPSEEELKRTPRAMGGPHGPDDKSNAELEEAKAAQAVWPNCS